MNTPRRRGTTWGSPRSKTHRTTTHRTMGGGLLATAMLAIVAMVATIAPPTPQTDTTVPDGLLGTSMVEMLDSESNGIPVPLVTVRSAVEATLDNQDIDGSGIDVAVIDTGVAPVDGLDNGNVLHGPDLSLEASVPELEYLDTYGHGTHMAGIIAGQRNDAQGIAPGARIISIKVAGHDGLTSVEQVIAAIDWVVEHRNTDGLNIRVLNLSLGQAGVTTHIGDPLSAAVERAWDHGIFVVVAAGNNGDTRQRLDSPAIDPYVMAVGGHDYIADDVPAWSATGDGDRNPDVIAPGRSIASYRVPGSTIDTLAPSARHGDTFFLGSGTSQAAAVVSGTAALILQSQPELTPDELKATLLNNAVDRSGVPAHRDGHGIISANKADKELDTTGSVQSHAEAAGPGTGIVAPSGNSWSGGSWSGGSWSGNSWSGNTWSGGSWSGNSWSGNTWSGGSWSGNSWSGNTWSGGSWSGGSWSGGSWSGGSWSGAGWA